MELWLKIFSYLDVEACARASVICHNALWARKKTVPAKVAKELPNLVAEFYENKARFPKTKTAGLANVDQIVLFLLRRRQCLHCVKRKVTQSGVEFWKALGLTMCWRCLQTSRKIVSRTEYDRVLKHLGKRLAERRAILDARPYARSYIRTYTSTEGRYYYLTATHDSAVLKHVQRYSTW